MEVAATNTVDIARWLVHVSHTGWKEPDDHRAPPSLPPPMREGFHERMHFRPAVELPYFLHSSTRPSPFSVSGRRRSRNPPLQRTAEVIRAQ